MLKIVNTYTPHSNYIYQSKRQHPTVVTFGQSDCFTGNSETGESSSSRLNDIVRNIKTLLNEVENEVATALPQTCQQKNIAHGTIINNAKPLQDFWESCKNLPKGELIAKGRSTNITGDSYALLKSKSENPLSTSFVQNCSVIYLYNEKTKTHFLYHLYPDMDINELKKTIEIFLPEGYTKACIVPGDSYFQDSHKQYLPVVTDLIKKQNPQANVETFYSKSAHPEIVGYEGNVYEIENKNWKKGKLGQASFRISNFTSYDIFYGIDRCKNEKDIEDLKNIYCILNMDETLTEIVDKLTKERAKDFSKPFFEDLYNLGY